jgi:hypothetical protein
LLLVSGQPLFVHVPLQALIDRVHCPPQIFFAYIAHDDRAARSRCHLRNAIAHRSRSNYAYDLSHGLCGCAAYRAERLCLAGELNSNFREANPSEVIKK